MQKLNLNTIHPSWLPMVTNALAMVDPHYIESLEQNPNWLPGPQQIFNAFSLPLNQVQYILFGESPYPRAASANGYAFWDNRVNSIWSDSGLSTEVNRATSLRNFIKMLLITNNDLSPQDTSQEAIATLNKSQLVQQLSELFLGMQQKGILLLNACLVLSENGVRKDAKAWEPFMRSILAQLAEHQQSITLILLGKVANKIQSFIEPATFSCLIAEHPYNISFINNPKIIDFFKPLKLLQATANQQL